MKMIPSYKRDNVVLHIRNMSGDNRLGIDAEGHRQSSLSLVRIAPKLYLD